MALFIAILMYLGFIAPVQQQMTYDTLNGMIMNNQPAIDQTMMNPEAQPVINEVYIPQVAKIELIDQRVGN